MGRPVGTEIRRHGPVAARSVVPHYACLDRKRRGPAVCTNAVVPPQAVLDSAILRSVTDALDPEAITRAVTKALAELTKRRDQLAERRAGIERELGLVQQRLDRLIDALADGSLPQEELKNRLTAETSKKKTLVGELDRLGRLMDTGSVNVEEMTARLRAKVADVAAVLGRQTPQARQMLRKLLAGGKIALEPVGSGRERGYKFRGALAIDRLIGGEAIGTHLTVVAPTGFEPVFQP